MMLTDIQIYGSLSEEQKKCIVHYHVFIFFQPICYYYYQFFLALLSVSVRFYFY